MLRAENAALQEELLRAVRRALKKQAGSNVGFDALLTVMSEAAKGVVAPITNVLRESPGHVQGLEVATPGDWAEVVWSLALKLQSTGPRALDVALHGSGNQTFLMYVMTHFLDTRFSQEFGWHQATIWAIEEPESFLHADLKNQLASFLAKESVEGRFQVMLTTHELLFGSAADQRYEVIIADGATEATPRSVLELAERTLAAGVTPFVHPLNLTAPKPTLLVDGPFDVIYLTGAYALSARTSPWDIRSLEELDPAAGGSGKTLIRQYLQQNQGPLKARPGGSPVVVLLDWEDSEDERSAMQQLLDAHPASRAVIWPGDRTNPDLGESFRGIERYLSTELVRAVAQAAPDLGLVQTPAGKWEIMPQKKSATKKALTRAFQHRQQVDDVRLIIEALPWLESQLPAATVPATLPGL